MEGYYRGEIGIWRVAGSDPAGGLPTISVGSVDLVHLSGSTPSLVIAQLPATVPPGDQILIIQQGLNAASYPTKIITPESPTEGTEVLYISSVSVRRVLYGGGTPYVEVLGAGFSENSVFTINGIAVVPLQYNPNGAVLPIPSPVDEDDMTVSFTVAVAEGPASYTHTRSASNVYSELTGAGAIADPLTGEVFQQAAKVESNEDFKEIYKDICKKMKESVACTDSDKTKELRGKIEAFLKAIIMHESEQYTKRKQDRGPARGLGQIEPNTFLTAWCRANIIQKIKNHLKKDCGLSDDDIADIDKWVKAEKKAIEEAKRRQKKDPNAKGHTSTWENVPDLEAKLTKKCSDGLSTLLVRARFMSHDAQKFSCDWLGDEKQPVVGTPVVDDKNPKDDDDITATDGATGKNRWAEEWRRWYHSGSNLRPCVTAKGKAAKSDSDKEFDPCKFTGPDAHVKFVISGANKKARTHPDAASDAEWIALRKCLRDKFLGSLCAGQEKLK